MLIQGYLLRIIDLEVRTMSEKTIWNELIKPTLLAYFIALIIPAGIAVAYYVYINYF